MSTDREREALAREIYAAHHRDPRLGRARWDAGNAFDKSSLNYSHALKAAEMILAAGWMPRPDLLPGAPDEH